MKDVQQPVNLEDLAVDFGLQHFTLCLLVMKKAMKKLTRNLTQEDSIQCLKMLSQYTVKKMKINW